VQPTLDHHRAVILFAPEAAVLALDAVGEYLIPFDDLDKLFDVVGRPPGGIEPADDRPHAGADYQIGGDVELF
jgi:hypothetical protein